MTLTKHERNLIADALRLMAMEEVDQDLAIELRELADRVADGEDLN